MVFFLNRVWNVDKRNKDGSPTLARTIRAIIPGAKQQCPVSVHTYTMCF